jgi:hypothetical protein
MHVYELRPRKDHRGIDLISDALPFGRLWYGEPDAVASAIDYAGAIVTARCDRLRNFAYSIALLTAFGSAYHSTPNGRASEIRSTPHARKAQETVNLSENTPGSTQMNGFSNYHV